MKKRSRYIFINADLCTGCHLCEIACSMFHHSICNPRRSRIRVHELKNHEHHEHHEHYVPVICQACDEAPCIKVCPVNARGREENGTVTTNDEKCIGCRACVYICHLGSPVINPETGKTMTCDMCAEGNSEPWCVSACRFEGALQMFDYETFALQQSRRRAGTFFKKPFKNKKQKNRN